MRADEPTAMLWPHRFRAASWLVLLCVLAGCAGPHRSTSHAWLRTSPGHFYPPPGPPNDPWGPYIRDASARFGVPDLWVREVMRQESGGQEQVVSSAGAMGLMQVMPDTYVGLQQRYGLGNDPFEPHDNILAGTAYIREMYDLYGAPGFLAAYNAGPNRLNEYLATGNPLPDETVGYVAAIAPRIAAAGPMTGPLSVYAGGEAEGGGMQYASAPAAASSGSCDPDAAYDPARPCAPAVVAAIGPALPVPGAAVAAPPLLDPPFVAELTPAATPPTHSLIYDPNAAYASAASPSAAPNAAYAVSDPNAAYAGSDPNAASAAGAPATAAAVEARPAIQPVAAAAGSTGGWAIQVGAFLDRDLARAAADNARLAAPGLLDAAQLQFPTTEPFGGTRLYRARLANLSLQTASQACSRLQLRQQACLVVPSGRL